MRFTVTINDTRKLAGITAAREAYNASLPDVVTPSEEPGGEPTTTPNPDRIDTDAAYVSFVMDRAAESYANQHGVPA